MSYNLAMGNSMHGFEEQASIKDLNKAILKDASRWTSLISTLVICAFMLTIYFQDTMRNMGNDYSVQVRSSKNALWLSFTFSS